MDFYSASSLKQLYADRHFATKNRLLLHDRSYNCDNNHAIFSSLYRNSDTYLRYYSDIAIIMEISSAMKITLPFQEPIYYLSVNSRLLDMSIIAFFIRKTKLIYAFLHKRNIYMQFYINCICLHQKEKEKGKRVTEIGIRHFKSLWDGFYISTV